MKPTDFLTNGQVNQAAVDVLIAKVGHIMNGTHGVTYAEYLTNAAERLNKKLSETGERGHEVVITKSPIWATARDAEEIIKVSKMKVNERGFLIQE